MTPRRTLSGLVIRAAQLALSSAAYVALVVLGLANADRPRR